MSLTTAQLPLAHSPRYILNNLTMTSTTSSPYTSNTPSPNPFLLRTISPPPPMPTPTLVDNYSHSDSERGEPETIPDEALIIEDPVRDIAVTRLPEHMMDAHLIVPAKVFAIHGTTPRLRIRCLPLPLHDLTQYRDLKTSNSIYHITVSGDEAPIILNQPGLRDTRTFFFYLQQMILATAYQVFEGPLSL